MQQANKFSIKLPAGTDKPSVLVNGQEIVDQIAGLSVQTRDAGLPVLILEAAGELDLDAEGVVYVAQGMNDQQVIASFLDSVDPSNLERLMTLSFDLGTTTGEACLDVLKGMVSADSNR